jgi:hypothetical protein
MTKPALIASAARDRRVHGDQIPGLEARYLLANIGYNRAALMPDRIGETHDLIPDSSLCVIVEVGSADADPQNFKQNIVGMLQLRLGPFHNLDLPGPGEH